ncbi:hypothetical protein BaRGS_00011630 [Batillaria attramentaria]|uniref:Ankyrin n=1 Tax=Batillaria attramentaria TaxID=370345 RepID=A0ABD0LCJ5_9CAEN
MDQKELEDRMAAAEALSSLGLPADFRASEPPVQGMAVDTQPPVAKNTKSTRGRGRGRGREKGDNRDTGRETKSRSTRGRGRARDTQQSATRNMPALPPTTSAAMAQGGNFLLLQQQLQQPPTDAPPQPKRRNTGGRRGKQATQVTNQGGASATITSRTGVAVHNDARLVQDTPGTSICTPQFQHAASITSIPGGARNGKVTVSPSAASSAAASIPYVHAGLPPGVSIPLSLSTSTGAAAAAGRIPTTPTDSLPSQPFLKSLPSLPSLSLGSTGLPSTGLPSVPNLPSLPSAIAALQLSGTGVPDVASLTREDAAGLDSQLSPHGRDSDEKSLPLKKRKIFDSSAVSSPKANAVSSVPSSPLVTVPSTSAPIPTPAPVQQERAAEVLTPGPTPVHLLTQVLPPAVSMQLLSEINTAITPDEDGDLPLHIAVVHENEAMVKKLIQLMALAGRRVDRYNKQQQTPLHLAIKLSYLPAIQMLLEAGANPNETPLHLAIKLSYLPAIQMLLEAGANPNEVDSTGLTSIHMAVQGRDLDCLEALLQWSKFPCDLNNRNFEGLAPLHTAVINNDLDIVKTLLDHNADINIMDGKSGRTVLFHAAEGNQRTAVELLLRRGADPEIANYAGVIPAMAAQGRSHTFVSRLLTRAVDEGVDEMALSAGNAEEMEVSSPANNLEIVVSDESSDSVRTSASDKARNTLAAMRTHPVLMRSLSRGQPQSPSQPAPSTFVRRNSQGPTITVSTGSGANGTGKIIVTSSGTPTPSQSSPFPANQPWLRPPLDNAKSDSNQAVSEPVQSPQALMGLQQKMAQLLMHSLVMRAMAEHRKEESQTGVNLTNPSSSGGEVSSSSSSVASIPSSSVGDVSVPSSSGTRLVSLPDGTVARVSPIPTSSIASPSGSRTEADSTSSPSPAHVQPTRPLLLFRSTSVDPGSGDGRRMGSVELRHVTADALLALQRSSTNSVNPANQRLRPVDSNLRSDPTNFEQLRNVLASSQPLVPRPNNIPMQIGSVPPVANHVSSDSLQHIRKFYDPNDSTDQPKDLSLKSRKPTTAVSASATAVKSEPEPVTKQLTSERRTVTHPYLEATLGKGPLSPVEKMCTLPAFSHMNSVGPQQDQKPAKPATAKAKAKRTRKPKAAKEKAPAKGKETITANFERITSDANAAGPAPKFKAAPVSEDVITPAVLESTKLALQVKISNSNESKPTAAVLTTPGVDAKLTPTLTTTSAAQGKELLIDKGQTTPSVIVSLSEHAKPTTNKKKAITSGKAVQSFQGTKIPVIVEKTPQPFQQTVELTAKEITSATVQVTAAKTVQATSPSSIQAASQPTDEDPAMPVLEAEGCMPPPQDGVRSEKDTQEDCPDLSDDTSVDMARPPSPDSPALVIDTGEGSPASPGDSRKEQPMETG